MDWINWLFLAIGLYIGSHIPSAWAKWKVGTAMIRKDIATRMYSENEQSTH